MARKKEIKTFIYCPEKRGEKIKQDAFMMLAKLNGKRAGRGPERRISSYIDKETRSKEMVQKQNKV